MAGITQHLTAARSRIPPHSCASILRLVDLQTPSREGLQMPAEALALPIARIETAARSFWGTRPGPRLASVTGRLVYLLSPAPAPQARERYIMAAVPRCRASLHCHPLAKRLRGYRKLCGQLFSSSGHSLLCFSGCHYVAIVSFIRFLFQHQLPIAS